MKRQVSPHDLTPGTQIRVHQLIVEGKLIPAIKLVRQATGVSLKEAKRYVDDMQPELVAAGIPLDTEARALGLLAEDKAIPAIKLVREETGLGLKEAKRYVDRLRAGHLRPRQPADHAGHAGHGAHLLSDRVRAFKVARDLESAIAVVRAETGMSRDEALRFVQAIE